MKLVILGIFLTLLGFGLVGERADSGEEFGVLLFFIGAYLTGFAVVVELLRYAFLRITGRN